RELGHDMTIRAWATLVAPKDTPKDVLYVLRASATKVANSPEFVEYFLKQGIDPTNIVGEEANKMMKDDDAMYAEFLAQIQKNK
ncbi:MAG: tripartite tricarboxylate transporter substrate binding protein, partial [Succinivibrio sp.]|nr:tripartite tricarboxylate transporter substrate binding protein [Succinivibrio sp.]